MASACLAGVYCRHDGKSKPHGELPRLFVMGKLFPFCPEVLAGLPTPREPMTLAGGDGDAVLSGAAKVMGESGTDHTSALLKGARTCVALAHAVRPKKIILKSKSPSCNCSPEGGFGVTAALLRREGFLLESAG